MNIISQSFSNAISFLQQNVHHPLTRKQTKIVFIASVALAFLAACYFFKCCCFKAETDSFTDKNGPGKLTKEGKVFEGTFNKGKLEGPGTITHPDGMKEEGEFKNDVFDGPGKVIAKDKTVMVEGTFSKGKLTGPGKMVFPNKDEYEGEFKNGVPHGFGKFFDHKEGITYQGEYQNGLRNGDGQILEKDGTVKDVVFAKGKMKSAVIHIG